MQIASREIIDDAVKTAEARKRKSLLELRKRSIKNKNELEKETKERRQNCRDTRNAFFPKKRL